MKEVKENKNLVEVVSPDNEVGTIPAENLDSAVADGFKLLTPELKKKREAVDFAQDNPALATGAAIARGLTLTGSDLVLTKTGLAKPETLKALEEENPELSVAGEVIGNVAPALLSGGTSLLAKTVTTIGKPALLAMRAGEAVASKVGSKIAAEQAVKGVTKNVLKETLDAGKKLAAAGATEGAIYGVADAIDESVLGNADLSAENLIKGAGYGAVLGGSIGFGIGATGTGVKRTLDKAVDLVDRSVVKNSIKSLDADDEVKKSLMNRFDSDENIDFIKKEIAKVKKNTSYLNEIEPEVRTSIESALPVEGMMAEYADDTLRSGVSPIATEYAEKSELATQKIREATNDIFKGRQSVPFSEVGDAIETVAQKRLDDITKPMSDAYQAIDEMLTPIEVTQKDLTKVIKQFRDSEVYTDSLVSHRKETETFLKDLVGVRDYVQAKKLRSSLLEEARGLEISGKYGPAKLVREMANAADNLRIQLIKKLPKKEADIILPALKDLDKEWAKASSDTAYLSELFGAKAEKGLTNAKTAIKNKSKEYKDSAALAEKLMKMDNIGFLKKMQAHTPELFDLWKSLQLNKLYAKSFSGAKGAKDINPKFLLEEIRREKLTHGDVVDLVFTPKQVKKIEAYSKAFDKLTKNKNPSGAAKFINFLDFIQNPLLSLAKDKLMLAIAKGDLGLVKKEAGLQAQALSKIADNNINQENKVIRSAKGFIKSLEKGSSFARSGIIRGAVNIIPYTKDELEKSEKAYKELQTNPMQMIETFQSRNPELNESLPEVSNAASQVVTRAIEYLQQKIPPQNSDYFLEDYSPSKSAIFKFTEYAEAVFTPDKVLDKMKSGYISPRQLEAMEHVYPETVAKLREHIIDNLPKAKISEKGKNFIQLVLGVQTKPSLQPQNITSLQSSFVQLNKEEMNGVVKPRVKNPKISENIAKQVSSDHDKSLYRRSLS